MASLSPQVSEAETNWVRSVDNRPHVDNSEPALVPATRKYQGMGIGLALAKDLVSKHGGAVSVSSVPGKGTTFVIDFPRTSARPMAQAAG